MFSVDRLHVLLFAIISHSLNASVITSSSITLHTSNCPATQTHAFSWNICCHCWQSERSGFSNPTKTHCGNCNYLLRKIEFEKDKKFHIWPMLVWEPPSNLDRWASFIGSILNLIEPTLQSCFSSAPSSNSLTAFSVPVSFSNNPSSSLGHSKKVRTSGEPAAGSKCQQHRWTYLPGW